MKYILYAIISIIAFVLSRDLFGHLTFYGAIPNINLLLVIIMATESPEPDFIFSALCGGLLTDIGFGVPVGTFTLPFLLVGIFVHQIFHGWISVSVTWRNLGIAIAAAVIVMYVLAIAMSKIMIATHLMPFAFEFSDLRRVILFSVIYNILVGYPLYLLYNIVQNYFSQFNRTTYKLR